MAHTLVRSRSLFRDLAPTHRPSHPRSPTNHSATQIGFVKGRSPLKRCGLSFAERILDRVDWTSRTLRQRRDDRVSWELSRTPTALYFVLGVLNSLFYVAYLVLTCNLTWVGYRMFFALITGALSLLYIILIDLGDIQSGSFTVNAGLRREVGTAPIMKPVIETIEIFLQDAKEECVRLKIPLKPDEDFRLPGRP